MPTYEKATLDTFKVNLKEGKYESLAGARRAVGKMSAWSEKDKDQARDLAAKHFGAEPAAKPAAKAAPKKTAKVAAKKTAKAAPVGQVKPAAKKGRKASAASTGNAQSSELPTVLRRTPQPETPEEARLAAREFIVFAGDARKELNNCLASDPKLDVTAANTDIFNIVQNATAFMRQASSSLVSEDGGRIPAQQIEVPQTKPSGPIAAPVEEKTEVKSETKSEDKAPAVTPPAPQSTPVLTEADKRAVAAFGAVTGLNLPAPQ